MQFSLDWLGEYVDLSSVPEDELARRLTAVGLAVEGRERHGEDVVLDVDVTTNRPDAMCHLGLAREAAVALEAEWTPPPLDLPEASGPDAGLVAIEAPELCRRYVGWVIQGVAVGPSPEWLARRLEAVGLRPINNVVDVTNYVLWETGQPLHAFDRSKLSEGRIVVREARAGETLRTLDGEDRKLGAGMLVIADGERPVALAGVMGGEESEVGEGTSEILLESAWFDPGVVRRTARGLGIHTDASHRFERGADPEAQLKAAARAVALILETAGGEAEPSPADARGEALASTERIHLEPDRLDRFAGTRIPAASTQKALVGLGFDLEPTEGEPGWSVSVPSWRRFDVLEEADLFEEVLRVVGFDRIPAALPAVEGPDAPEPETHRLRRVVQDHLAACGFAESVSYAFYGEEDDALFRPWVNRGEVVRLENPLSELYDRMRRTLLPGLVASARFNRRRNREAVRLFELGHVFWRREGGEPEETEHVALVVGGSLGTPWEGRREIDFFDAKGVVESLFDRLGIEAAVTTASIEGLLEGTVAEWRRDDGARVAILGRFAEEDASYPLFVAEVALWDLPLRGSRAISPPSRYPGVTVDLTLTHDRTVPWAEIELAIEAEDVSELVTFRLKDRYEGKGVPKGAVNTTITFHYRAEERSLTQEEVNERQERLTHVLVDRFGRKES